LRGSSFFGGLLPVRFAFEGFPLPSSTLCPRRTFSMQSVLQALGTILFSLAWTAVVVGAVLGAVFISTHLFSARGDQQAVVVGIGLACAVIPYCIARAATAFVWYFRGS
jgi:hypothetical protein